MCGDCGRFCRFLYPRFHTGAQLYPLARIRMRTVTQYAYLPCSMSNVSPVLFTRRRGSARLFNGAMRPRRLL